MIGRLGRATFDFLKVAWEQQPILVVATVMGFAGKRLAYPSMVPCKRFLPFSEGPLFVAVSSFTDSSQRDRLATPRVYKGVAS